jgi:hypothetical protein
LLGAAEATLKVREKETTQATRKAPAYDDSNATTLVISMWSGPRNISTTMMRAFASRPDMAAIDEPFYAAFLARTGADHPYRKETLAAWPQTFDGVLSWIASRTEKPALFLKHIAYHLPDGVDFSFLRGWRNILLIRDPRAMVASFADRFEDVTPIVRSYEIELAIRDYLAREGVPCPVVDAADILAAPEPTLRALCASLGLSFESSMLAWPDGPRPEDGPWAPHWYAAVRASTGFKPPVEKKITLPKELEAVAAAATPAYEKLRSCRLTA